MNWAAVRRCWRCRCIADYALIKAERGDRWGNLYLPHDGAQLRPIMAAAARITVGTVQ